MNALSQLHKLTPGCREFQPVATFPYGTNSFVYADAYKAVINNTDPAAPALAVYDLGFLKAGTRVVFDIEARCVSGATGNVAIESRSAPENLTASRKIVALGAAPSAQWEPLRLEWIVADGGQYISANIGGSTLSTGVVEFRNPQFQMFGNDQRAPGGYACDLLRIGGAWSVDNTIFHNIGGFKVTDTTGDSITLGFNELEGLLPVPVVSADTGYLPATTGFLLAGPHTITKNSMKIRLLKTDGTAVAAVAAGGDCRINVALFFR